MLALSQPSDPGCPPAPAVPPLLAALRAGTVAAHQRMETSASMACLLAPDLTAGAYIAALQAMAEFHRAMIAQLAPFIAADPALRGPDPAALAALTDDLAWFGAVPRAQSVGRMKLATRAAALGALYVVEGSALGGRVIGRAVERSLSVSPGRGGSFYCGVTADAARRRWRDFCAILAREGELLDSAGFGQVVAGANATFASLERRLQVRVAAPARRTQREPRREIRTALTERARSSARTMI